MAEKKILREWFSLDYKPELIKELRQKSPDGPIVIPALLQTFGVKNANGRRYPEHVLRREAENYQKAIRERRAVGELDHPDRSTVNFKEASHLIRKSWWDNSNLMGELEVLKTPNGKILESLLESGVRVGISSRGVGSTTSMDEGVDEVNDDYQIICWDCVSEPSTPGAFLFKEGKLIDFNARATFGRADRIYRALNDIVRSR